MPLIPSWDPGRATSLLAMWSMMSCAMMLPCAAAEILNAGPANRRFDGVPAAAASFSLGYLAVLVTMGAVGAAAEWTFEAAGGMVIGSPVRDPVLKGSLLLIAGLVELPKLRLGQVGATCSRVDIQPSLIEGFHHARSHIGPYVTMICLQLVGGAMDFRWMAVVGAWMLGAALAPSRKLSALLGFCLLAVTTLAFAGPAITGP
jgi:predicted metal-binding membrane protein